MKTYTDNACIRVYYCRNSAHVKEIPGALAKLGLRDDVVLEALPCGGKADPRYLLKAFEGGARAVCVLACPKGQCKMMEGNFRAARRAYTVREMLSEVGLDPDSVQIYLPNSVEEDTLDAAMAAIARFAESPREPVHSEVVN